jgi:Flp pilus assembly protein TadG
MTRRVLYPRGREVVSMFSFGRYLMGRALALRFRKSTSGVTAIEFAMIIPMFMLVLGVMMETGIMMFTEYVLQTSVQEAARLVRTGQAQEAKYSSATFKTAVCRIAKVIMSCESKVTIYMKAGVKFDDFVNDASNSFMAVGVKPDGTFPPTTFKCGKPNEVVSLIATYDYKFTMPYFMHYFGNLQNGNVRRMAGFAMFKNEPFPAVAANVCGT